MDILSYLKNNIVILDGAMGTCLQKNGLKAGQPPERMNVSDSAVVSDIHLSYINAGSNVLCTNTFGANILKFDRTELRQIISAAVENAKNAAARSEKDNVFVALDIGPTGRLLKPNGDLEFEDAVGIFAETVKLGAEAGADLVFIETMTDSYETKAAVIAAKENCSLPVFVSNAYGEDGKLLTGATPRSMTALLEGLGADAIGVNCSLSPDKIKGVVSEYLRYASVPVIVKPNAGIPSENSAYETGAEEFASEMAGFARMGARLLGGCCGTDAAYIAAVKDKIKEITSAYPQKKDDTLISAFGDAVEIGNNPLIIGERINPTGKKRFRQALAERDFAYILRCGSSQVESGAAVLDVNVGAPEIDETELLPETVKKLQSVFSCPLQLDSSNAAALCEAMRVYNGKPLVNSVNGSEKSMNEIFPLVKKYGGAVVALTLDEKGIPETAEERFAIAERIAERAESYGIEKKNIVFDTLVMTVAADKNAANVTLSALGMIKEKLGCKTVLGISNISFGLPSRETVNSAFLSRALYCGLDCAIVNPLSAGIKSAFLTNALLSGFDGAAEDYTGFASETEDSPVPEKKLSLESAVEKGFRDDAAALAGELLKTENPLDIINRRIIPALNTVGENFQSGRTFLPGLLASAEAANAALSCIKNASKTAEADENAVSVVLATVEGDVHDIGKSIVKLLLESYGFRVYDLGKNVPAETVLNEVKRLNAPLAGLSALMTTTVPAMKKTTELLKREAPFCRVCVGGAVLTEETASAMGADKYCATALDTVKFAQTL